MAEEGEGRRGGERNGVEKRRWHFRSDWISEALVRGLRAMGRDVGG